MKDWFLETQELKVCSNGCDDYMCSFHMAFASLKLRLFESGSILYLPE